MSDIIYNTQTHLGPLFSGVHIRQRFVAENDGLSGIALLVATFGKKLHASTRLVVEADSGSPLSNRSVVSDAARFLENTWHQFVFDPIPASRGLSFWFNFECEADPAEPLTLWTNNTRGGSTYKNETLLPEAVCFKCLYTAADGTLYSQEAGPALRRVLAEYMPIFTGSFAYQNILNGHLDVTRFYPILRDVEKYRPIAGATVFSSGCGSAGDLYACLDLGASRVYGIEVDEQLWKMGRARFENTPWVERADLRLYDGFSLPYQDQAFDLILSLHVIEHTQDNALYLRELFRVLKPGGVLILDLPDRYYSHEMHTGIPLINILPAGARKNLIRLLLSPWLSRLCSPVIREKLRAILVLNLPSPARLIQIYRSCKIEYDLKILDACYHGYGELRVPETPLFEEDSGGIRPGVRQTLAYILQILNRYRRRLSNFRLVATRLPTDSHS